MGLTQAVAPQWSLLIVSHVQSLAPSATRCIKGKRGYRSNRQGYKHKAQHAGSKADTFTRVEHHVEAKQPTRAICRRLRLAASAVRKTPNALPGT